MCHWAIIHVVSDTVLMSAYGLLWCFKRTLWKRSLLPERSGFQKPLGFGLDFIFKWFILYSLRVW